LKDDFLPSKMDVAAQASLISIEGELVSNRSRASAYWAMECRKSEMLASDATGAELKVVDLFSGCGGLSLGAAIACTQLDRRLKIEFAADSWEEALAVYKSNFKDSLSASSTEDLSVLVESPGSTTLTPRGLDIAKACGEIDVVMAGPPCQGHSDLNNSSRRDDPRNLLYTIPVALGIKTKAKVLIIENVPTVVHATDKVVSSALVTLRSNGYSVVEFLANAEDFGLPQARKRHVLIASRIHSAAELKTLTGKIPRRTEPVGLWNFISDLEDTSNEESGIFDQSSKISAENALRIKYLFESDSYDLPDRLRPACHRDKAHSYVSMYGRLRPEHPAQTITSGFGSMGQGRFVHPTRPRMITPHEAARIQGFPDYFSFAEAKKLTALRKMIGNAVAPPVCAVLIALLFKNGSA